MRKSFVQRRESRQRLLAHCRVACSLARAAPWGMEKEMAEEKMDIGNGKQDRKEMKMKIEKKIDIVSAVFKQLKRPSRFPEAMS